MATPTATRPPDPDADLADVVLDTVRGLVDELNPGRAPIPVHLDSSLERDVALDSLALVELRERLERACRVRLPDRAVAEVDTPRGWVSAVVGASGRPPPPPAGSAVTKAVRPVAASAGPPADAETLGDVLAWHSAAHPESVQVCLLDYSGSSAHQIELTCASLERRARAVAHGLIDSDVEPGQSVEVMLPTSIE